jgi:transposase InsO family protein
MPRGVAYPYEFRLAMMRLHEQGQTFTALGRQCQVPRDVLGRWWKRYQADGPPGLAPRSRRPQHSPHRVPPKTQRAILRWRHRKLGPARIALEVPASVSSVYRVLVAAGQQQLTPRVPRLVRRYEKTRPGELVHLDLKYLPALEKGPEFEFAAVDDYTREAVTWIAAHRTTATATTFLEHVVTQLGYPIDAVMTDNDLVFTMRFAFHSTRRTRFQQACQNLGIRHRLIRPHAPESNGKVERFIKTVDDECFAVRRPRSSRRRIRVLETFMEYYNHERRHLSLAGLTPVQRREAYFAQLQLMS